MTPSAASLGQMAGLRAPGLSRSRSEHADGREALAGAVGERHEVLQRPVQMAADGAVQVEGDGDEWEQSYASGVQQHPPGSGLPRAQITRGKNRLALTTGLGEARGANPYELLSGLAGMQTRRFGGFCYSGVLVFGLA